jgi:acyl-CoA thioesterase-1
LITFFSKLLLIAATISIVSVSQANENIKKILIFGDSLTAGYGLEQEDAFPAKLERSLKLMGKSVKIIPSSVSGDTSSGGNNRILWALSDKPDVVILELGANDGLRGIEPKVTYYNLYSIMEKLRRNNIKVLIAGMLAPPNLGKEYGKEFNRIYTRLSNEFNSQLYPFFLDGVVNKPHLNQPDGIHPNEAGVEEIIKRMLPMVINLIN